MIAVIKEFQGIIGTLLGVIITLITTHILRTLGRVRISGEMQKLGFFKYDGEPIGDYKSIEVYEIKDADFLEYNFKVTLYNSSDIPKSLYDIKLKFIDKNGNELIHVPFDADKQEYINQKWRHSILQIINLDPKRLELKYLYGKVKKKEGLKNLNSIEISKVYFMSLDFKKNEIKKKIYDSEWVKN